MDLVNADELAKGNKSVNNFLLRQDLLGGSVDAKIKKTKDSKATVRAFSNKTPKKKRPEMFLVHKGRDFAGEFDKL